MPVPDLAKSELDPAIAARLKRTADGLVPAIVRERGTGDVLMLAWMNDEALHRTLTTGRATYWSRSRSEYWVKGATSGHHQFVRAVALDCDGDALLLTVDQIGPACHTGTHTCFTDQLPMAGNHDQVPTAGDHDQVPTAGDHDQPLTAGDRDRLPVPGAQR